MFERQFIIYGLTDPDGSVRYVGLSRCGLLRAAQHGYPSNVRKQKPSSCWIRALRASGQTYGVKILQVCACVSELAAAEQRWVAQLRGAGARLLNCTDGGEGLQNPTPEIRARMTASRTGVKRPPRSPEWCAKLSAALAGRTVAPAAREKRRATMTGRPWSDKQRAGLEAVWARKKAAGLTRLSDDDKKRLSESAKKQWQRQARPIIDLATGIVYQTQQLAGDAAGVTAARVGQVARRMSATRQGHRFRYVDQIREPGA